MTMLLDPKAAEQKYRDNRKKNQKGLKEEGRVKWEVAGGSCL
jgi:hypothetical protein